MAYNAEIQLDESNVLELKGGALRTHIKIIHNGEPVGTMVFLLSKGKFEREIAGHLVRLEYQTVRGTGHKKLFVKVNGEIVKESLITQ